MASNLRVDSIVPATGSSVSIGTATGGVNIPGVLTYEDVTNVDSVGVITARSGIRIGATGANTLIQGAATGISLGTGTPRQKLHINASDSGAANMVFTNATTGTAAGDGFVVGITGGEDAQLNMQESANLKFSTADTERLRIGSAGQLGIGGANYGTSGQVLTSQGASSAVQWATPSSGSMTLLHTMNINMTANTQSQSLNLTGYQKLMGTITSLSRSGGVNDSWLTFNGNNSSGDYSFIRTYLDNSGDTSTSRSGSGLGYPYGSVGPGFFINLAGIAAADSGNIDAEFTVHNLQDGGRKPFVMTSRSFLTRNIVIDTRGSINTTSAITSIALNVTNAVSRNTGGTIKLYGFK